MAARKVAEMLDQKFETNWVVQASRLKTTLAKPTAEVLQRAKRFVSSEQTSV